MGFLRHQSLSSFWGKLGAHICLPILSSLEGTECAMLIPVSPLIHPPALISASALENNPTPRDPTLGAWRSLLRRIWWVRELEGWGFLLVCFCTFWLLLLVPHSSLNTQHLSLLEPPIVEQRCRASHHRAATVFLWSRSRLKSGGRAGKTGTQLSQCLQERRLCDPSPGAGRDLKQAAEWVSWCNALLQCAKCHCLWDEQSKTWANKKWFLSNK